MCDFCEVNLIIRLFVKSINFKMFHHLEVVFQKSIQTFITDI